MIRPIRSSSELDSVINVLAQAFDYPDHPEWSIQEDTVRGLRKRVTAYKRFLPLIKLLPSLDKRIQILVHETSNDIDGVSVFYETSSSTWYLAYMAVMPQSRRKGVGKQLLHESIALVRQLGGEVLDLDVRLGNTPAQNLYTSAGFSVLSRRTVLRAKPSKLPIEHPALSTLQIAKGKDWQMQYELAREILPIEKQKSRPITAKQFKPSKFSSIGKLMTRAAGHKTRFLTFKAGGQVLGWSQLFIGKNDQTTNSLQIMSRDEKLIAQELLIRSLNLLADNNRADTVFALVDWQHELLGVASKFCLTDSVDNTMRLQL